MAFYGDGKHNENMEHMNQFEENNPEQLRKFLKEFNDLTDEYHANIYTLDELWEGVRMIQDAINYELNYKETK